jgi:hypothetical protein
MLSGILGPGGLGTVQTTLLDLGWEDFLDVRCGEGVRPER